MKIDLIDLECIVDYDYEPESIGAVDEDGRKERLPAWVEILSVKSKGIDITPLLSAEQLAEIEDTLLNQHAKSREADF